MAEPGGNAEEEGSRVLAELSSPGMLLGLPPPLDALCGFCCCCSFVVFFLSRSSNNMCFERESSQR